MPLDKLPKVEFSEEKFCQLKIAMRETLKPAAFWSQIKVNPELDCKITLTTNDDQELLVNEYLARCYFTRLECTKDISSNQLLALIQFAKGEELNFNELSPNLVDYLESSAGKVGFVAMGRLHDKISPYYEAKEEIERVLLRSKKIEPLPMLLGSTHSELNNCESIGNLIDVLVEMTFEKRGSFFVCISGTGWMPELYYKIREEVFARCDERDRVRAKIEREIRREKKRSLEEPSGLPDRTQLSFRDFIRLDNSERDSFRKSFLTQLPEAFAFTHPELNTCKTVGDMVDRLVEMEHNRRFEFYENIRAANWMPQTVQEIKNEVILRSSIAENQVKMLYALNQPVKERTFAEVIQELTQEEALKHFEKELFKKQFLEWVTTAKIDDPLFRSHSAKIIFIELHLRMNSIFGQIIPFDELNTMFGRHQQLLKSYPNEKLSKELGSWINIVRVLEDPNHYEKADVFKNFTLVKNPRVKCTSIFSNDEDLKLLKNYKKASTVYIPYTVDNQMCLLRYSKKANSNVWCISQNDKSEEFRDKIKDQLDLVWSISKDVMHVEHCMSPGCDISDERDQIKFLLSILSKSLERNVSANASVIPACVKHKPVFLPQDWPYANKFKELSEEDFVEHMKKLGSGDSIVRTLFSYAYVLKCPSLNLLNRILSPEEVSAFGIIHNGLILGDESLLIPHFDLHFSWLENNCYHPSIKSVIESGATLA